MPYQVPPAHVHSAADDGRCYVHDPDHGRTWEVGPGALEVLKSVRAGWRPGDFVPGGLRARLAEERLVEADVPGILDQLARQGLLCDGNPPPPANAPWALRLPALPAPPVRLRAGLVRAAQWAPLPAAVILASGLLQAAHADYRFDPTRPQGLLVIAALYVLGQAILIVPHELGHALVLAAATGRRIAVGLRWGGWPLFLHAFTEASLLYTVPARSVRVAVLLAGTVAELFVWGFLLLCRPSLPASWQPALATIIALGGCWSVIGNLLVPIRNDGYYILADLARADDLEQRARAAAWQAFFAPQTDRATQSPWWLAWYGLAVALFAPALLLLIGLHFSRGSVGTLVLPLAILLAAAAFRRSFKLEASPSSIPS